MLHPKFMLALLLLAAIGSGAGSASAAVTLSFDMDTAAAGVQNSRTVAAGANFDVGVVLGISGTTQIETFQFGLRLDSNELTLNSFNFPASAISPLEPFGTINQTNGGSDVDLGGAPFTQLYAITGAPSTTGTLGAGEYLLGTVSLTATTPITDSSNDLVFGYYYEDGSGGLQFLDGFFEPAAITPIDVTFNFGTVTAVPEPATWIALGGISAGVAVRQLRRRKRRSVVLAREDKPNMEA